MALGPMMLDIEGLQVLPEEEALLSHPLTGGIILFARNYQDRQQLKALTEQIRAIANKPILISVDHEGGRVWRFHHQFTCLPSMQELGTLWEKDPSLALEKTVIAGQVLAQELLTCGVDISLTPNLDLHNDENPVVRGRAFHQNPDIVIKLASALVIGMQSAGMAATGKHFPGHGGCVVDTHEGVAIDKRTLGEIQAMDLLPYRQLADKLQAVLVSHVIYPKIDILPACFSKQWLTLLREAYQFRGAIISDCLSMRAVAKYGSLVVRVQKALDAGCDMVIASHFKRDELYRLLDALQYSFTALTEQRLAALKAKFDVSSNLFKS